MEGPVMSDVSVSKLSRGDIENLLQDAYNRASALCAGGIKGKCDEEIAMYELLKDKNIPDLETKITAFVMV